MDTSATMDKFFGFFQGDSPVLQFVGKYGYKAYEERELIQMYILLILSALFPIYIGSHASLHRPPSAASPKKAKAEDQDEDDVDVEPIVEGLSPSDAIMFPVLAGIILAILYGIIKWLEDPAILNKILGWYFSGLGIFGVGKLAADALNVATTFVFPSVWSSSKQTYYVDPLLSQQVTGLAKNARTQVHRKFVDKTNPLPGVLSSLHLNKPTTRALWSLRALLKDHWIFRGYLHGVFSIKTKVQINDVVGFLFGIAAIVLYNVNGKSWWLTNLIGFGFCYGTLQLLSPTTFWTGSLVLAGLFIYDITMVFYTPLMVTVATSLDVPIKLVFPGPKRGGMLGLGDIVLPGIMMALALRFDLYLHYLRKQRDPANAPPLSATRSVATSSGSLPIIKAPYGEASGVWGERFWTRGAQNAADSTAADGARFSKVYFKASLVGYIVGMLVTLVVLNVYNHAQPALLYLVPGVLIALWGTALVRREQKLMWNYTEDGSLEDDKEKVDEKNKKRRGKGGSSDSTISAGSGSTDSSGGVSLATSTDNTTDSDTIVLSQKNDKKQDEHAHHVFLFSLSSPREAIPKKAKLFDKE